MSHLRASLILTAITVLGAALSFANQVLIAHFFGATAELDAYLVAITIPMTVAGFVGQAFGYSLVPRLVEADSTPAGKAFVSKVIAACCALAFLLALLGILFAEPIMHLGAPFLNAGARAEAITIARISWATSGLLVLVAGFAALCTAKRRFKEPAITGLFPYAAMAMMLVVLGPKYGTLSIAWGLFIGAVCASAWLALSIRAELAAVPAFSGPWNDVWHYLSTLPVVFVATLIFGVHQLSDAFWAPRLGDGQLSLLGYAQRLLVAVGNLVIVGPSAVLVPTMTAAHLAGRNEEVRAVCGRALRLVLTFAALAAVVISVLALPIVQLVFQRGAFDRAATQGLASILPIMMLGMVAMLMVVMILRALFAISQTRAAAAISVLTGSLYFFGSGALGSTLGLNGIAGAYAISWWVALAAAAWALWGPEWRAVRPERVRFVLKVVCSVAAAGLVSHVALAWSGEMPPGLAAQLLTLTAIGSVSVGVFYLLAVCVFRMEDVAAVFRTVLRRR
jgi:putative peptidoglycan lipid II flippase